MDEGVRSGPVDAALPVEPSKADRLAELDASARSSFLVPRSSSPVVRIGLRYVRGLGSQAGKRLREALEAGPFASVEEVIERSGMGDAELRALAAAGAFRSLVPGDRREALWAVLGELRRRRTGGPLAPAASETPSLPQMSPVESTIADHLTVSMTLGDHPMCHLRERLSKLGVESIARLREPGRRHDEPVRTAGLVIVRQRPGTAKGFVFLGLEDETGRLDVIINPKLYAAEREIINRNGILAVTGKLGIEDDVVNLKAEAFHPIRLEDTSRIVQSHDYH